MALPIYLAMNHRDFQNIAELPAHTCWMACHFSAWGRGLSNFPSTLPPNSVLMVDDSVPPEDHDPDIIAQQLCDAAEKWCLSGVILDFQRPYETRLQEIANKVGAQLPCPAATTEPYLRGWTGAVLLPPIPPNKTAQAVLSPWKGRDVWLELDARGLSLQLRESGCTATVLSEPLQAPDFQDDTVCCHYSISLSDRQAEFLLQRTDEDYLQLMQQAETMGVSRCVGLYREFCRFYLSTSGHNVG